MKAKSPTILITLLSLAAVATAGFLPLWYDLPKRDNPNDPFNKRPVFTNNPPFVPTPTPACQGGSDTAQFNFEGGLLEGWTSTVAGGYTLITSITNVTSPSCNGTRTLCGSLNFTLGTDEKAIFYNSFSGNLSGRRLSAAVYVEPNKTGGGASVKMYIKSGGFVYSNGPSTNIPAAGGWLGLTFDLAQPPVYTSGVTNTANVQEIGIEFFSPGTEPNNSLTVCIDSWDPGANPTPTITPTVSPTPSITATFSPVAGTFTFSPTPSPSPTSCVPAANWSFESGTQGWVRDTAFDTGFTAVASSSAQSHECLSALECTASLANGANAGGVVSISGAGNGFPMNLTNQVISAWVYVPAGMSPASPQSGAFIYAKDGSWAWQQGAWENLPPAGGWTQVTFDLTGQAWASTVNEIGIKVGLGGCPACTPWSGTIYIDQVDIQ